MDKSQGTKKNTVPHTIALKVVTALKDLGCYIVNESVTTNSVYLKFKDSRLGSLRISDHKANEKYHYKWNIEVQGHTRALEKSGRKQYFYAHRDLIAFYEHIRKYHSKIQYASPRPTPGPTDLSDVSTELLLEELQRRGIVSMQPEEASPQLESPQKDLKWAPVNLTQRPLPLQDSQH